MTKLAEDTNPSGIEFDDPGPGAGVSDKVAAVAAKAKTVPGVKGRPKTKLYTDFPKDLKKTEDILMETVPKVKKKVWNTSSIEAYKAQSQLQEIEDKGGVIHTILPSGATQ